MRNRVHIIFLNCVLRNCVYFAVDRHPDPGDELVSQRSCSLEWITTVSCMLHVLSRMFYLPGTKNQLCSHQCWSSNAPLRGILSPAKNNQEKIKWTVPMTLVSESGLILLPLAIISWFLFEMSDLIPWCVSSYLPLGQSTTTILILLITILLIYRTLSGLQ